MQDFTKTTTTLTDFSEYIKTPQQLQPEDFELSSQEAGIATEYSSILFGDNAPAVTTQGDLEALNKVVKEDIDRVAKEADVEAVEGLIANGNIRTPEQASVLFKTMDSDKELAGENTALAIAATSKERFEAALNDQLIRMSPEYEEAAKKYSSGKYGTLQQYEDKMAITRQVLASVEEQQSNLAAIGAGAVNIVPFVADVRSYSGSVSKTPAGVFTNRTLEDVKEYDKMMVNPDVSAEDVYNFWKEYSAQHDPETVKQKLRSILERTTNSDQVFFYLDALSVGAGVGTALKAGASAVKTGKALGVGAKEITKAALKETGITATEEALKQIPGLKPVVATTVDFAKNPKKILKSIGNRKKFSTTIAQNIPEAAYETAEASKLAIEEAVATAVSPRLTVEDVTQTANMPEVQASKEAVAVRQNLQNALATKAGKLDEMNASNLTKLQQKAFEDFKVEHKLAQVDYADLVQMDVTPLRNGDNTYTFRYKIGTGVNNATHFDSAKAADDYAKALRIKGSSKIVKDKNGYWIIFDTRSQETLGSLADAAIKAEATAKGAKNIQETATASRLTTPFRGVTAKSTVTRRLTALASHEKDSTVLPLVMDAKRSIDSLNKTDAMLLDTIIKNSRSQERWITPEWLRANGASDKLVNAYNNYRALNDVDYIVANRVLTEELSVRGGKEVFFRGNRKGIEYIRDDDALDAGTMWFRVDGEEHARKLSPSEVADLKKKGYRFTETPYSDGDIPASRIRNAYNPSEFEARNLEGLVISYIPGGRNYYSSDNIFIKQLEVGDAMKRFPGQHISKPKYISGVHTITAGTSIDSAKEFAGLLEAARQTLIKFKNNTIDLGTANRELQAGLGAKAAWGGTVEAFEKFVQDSKISLDPDAVIEAVKDGETLQSYRNIMNANKAVDLVNSPEMFKRSASSLYTDEHAIARRLRSGGDIDELFDGFTPVRADPQEELKRLVNDISNMTTMRAYSQLYADNFKRIYGAVLKDNIPANKVLDLSSLKTAKEVGDDDLYAAAVNAIIQHNVVRGVPNKFDEILLKGFDNILRTLHISEDAIEKVHGANVLRKARVAESFINFAFAPAQLLRQASAIASTHLFNPVASLEADTLMFLYPFFKNGTPKIVDAALQAVGLKGVSENLGTFFKNVDTLRSKGNFYEGGVLDTGLDMKRTFVKASYIPYTTGETINRVHSSIVTLLSADPKAKLGTTLATVNNKYAKVDLNKVGAAELAELHNRYNRYYMNMDAAGKAPVQNSQAYQTALQFQTYKLRFWEVLADTELTKTQKGSFILGNIALYGAAGMGLGNIFTGDSDAERAINEGFLNYAVENVFGSGAHFIPDLTELGAATPFDIFGYGLNAGVELANTPIIRSSGQFANSVFRIYNAGMELVRDPDYTYKAFLEDMKWLVSSNDNPFSGVARTARATEAFLSNSLKNSRGITSAEDMSNLNTTLYLMGFNNLRDSQLWRAQQISNAHKQDINDIAKDLQGVFNAWVDTQGMDPDINRAYKALYKNATDSLSEEALIQVNEKLWYGLGQRRKDSLDKLIETQLRNMKLEPHRQITE